jgi:hypothetical protein
VVYARLVYAVLCLLDAALKMVDDAKVVARRAGSAGALLLSKVELAGRLGLEGAAGAAGRYSQLLRQGDAAGAINLAAVHASMTANCAASALQPVIIVFTQAVCANLPTPCRCAAACRPCRVLAGSHVSACRAMRWARARWASLDPAHRLPAAARHGCALACKLPCSTPDVCIVGLMLLSVGVLLFV